MATTTNADTPTTKPRTTKKASVEPFGIVIDHPRNNDVMLQSIPNCRLRSRISSNRTVKDSRTGRTTVPIDQSIGLANLSDTPG